MEQKFKRGFRVEILPRGIKGQWENTGIGCEAIIEYSSIEKNGERESVDGEYRQQEPCYRILIFHNNDDVRSTHWFEEKYLELVCCNEEKGKAILTKHDR